MRHLAILIIRAYQYTISPDHSPLLRSWYPGRSRVCRFEPTCSEYTIEAISRYGVFRGTVLGVKRIARCHPYSKHDLLDPVP